MLRELFVVALMLCSCLGAGRAGAQQVIGTVTRIQGGASGTRDAVTQPLGANASVYPNEVVSTGDGTRLEITFKDHTRLTLSEKVKLTLNTYIYNRPAGLGSIKFEIAGAFRFVSGRLSKLAKADVSVTTPVANIGIRGTDFWAGPIDNQALGVFLAAGAVSVSNTAGTQLLNQAGQGTNISAPGVAPGPVTFWPADKIRRALAAVTFR
ncbi:MAG TPA: FecR family protein [Xanthobacteraceae bacterium]|nr:FecR family protein [Xanthobacteraceae bacterium]